MINTDPGPADAKKGALKKVWEEQKINFLLKKFICIQESQNSDPE